MKRKKRKKILIIFGIVIFIIVCVILLLINNPFAKIIYSIDSRVENLNKTKDKDGDVFWTIGWLRVQGTNIDTPIITYDKNSKKTDENFLTTHNFLWNRVSEEKLFNKVMIMGHNIMNLSSKPEINKNYFSRFDDLMAFVYTDFVQKNKYVQYTIDGKEYLYKIYAVGFYDSSDLDTEPDKNYNKDDLKYYISETRKNSIFDFDVDVNENDKFISLITCTRLFGSDVRSKEFIVDARMVRQNEKAVNYKVKENKNYKKIKKILEGDNDEEDDEEV